jgi:hypothetical protein
VVERHDVKMVVPSLRRNICVGGGSEDKTPFCSIANLKATEHLLCHSPGIQLPDTIGLTRSVLDLDTSGRVRVKHRIQSGVRWDSKAWSEKSVSDPSASGRSAGSCQGPADVSCDSCSMNRSPARWRTCS